MLKIIISGCCGKMGHVLADICSADKDIEIVAGFDSAGVQYSDFPVFTSPAGFDGTADALIDFSNPSALDGLIEFGVSKHVPLVLCTTGYTPEQLEKINAASEKTAVFKSANMSVGINLLASLLKKAVAALGPDFDIEIVEKHHNRKLDAPSGTAILLADALSSAMEEAPEYVYERQSVRRPRGKQEIGISAVRGGTIPGEHEVIFAGLDEVITFKHTVYSRDVFAAGAVKAAKFIAGKPAGMYDMSSVISGV